MGHVTMRQQTPRLRDLEQPSLLHVRAPCPPGAPGSPLLVTLTELPPPGHRWLPQQSKENLVGKFGFCPETTVPAPFLSDGQDQP